MRVPLTDWYLQEGFSSQDPDFYVPAVQGYYGGANRSRERIIAACRASLCFGVWSKSLGTQIAFARVVTDYTEYSWLADVVVRPDLRGKGVGTFLMEAILFHPRLKGTVFNLGTIDAEGFYRRFGFIECRDMARWGK